MRPLFFLQQRKTQLESELTQSAREGSDMLEQEWKKVEEIKKDLEEQVVSTALCRDSLAF